MIEKCIGCGYCCQIPCLLAIAIHGIISKCPELEWNGERYICKIMDLRRKQELVNEFCCMPENEWRLDIRERKII